MKRTNALKLRQNLGALLNQLKKTGEPILVESRREPAAVLITIEDYQRRFVDRDADEKRRALVESILAMRASLPEGTHSSLDLIREIRE